MRRAYLRHGAHHHHNVSVVPTELRAGELHGEGQLGVVDGELGLQRDLVLLVRSVEHPDIRGRKRNHLQRRASFCAWAPFLMP